jgi:hypothetical protein
VDLRVGRILEVRFGATVAVDGLFSNTHAIYWKSDEVFQELGI